MATRPCLCVEHSLSGSGDFRMSLCLRTSCSAEGSYVLSPPCFSRHRSSRTHASLSRWAPGAVFFEPLSFCCQLNWASPLAPVSFFGRSAEQERLGAGVKTIGERNSCTPRTPVEIFRPRSFLRGGFEID